MFAPYVKEIFVEGRTVRDTRGSSSPVLASSLLFLRIFNALVVSHQSRFALVGMRLSDEAAQALEVRSLTLTLHVGSNAKGTHLLLRC